MQAVVARAYRDPLPDFENLNNGCRIEWKSISESKWKSTSESIRKSFGESVSVASARSSDFCRRRRSIENYQFPDLQYNCGLIRPVTTL